MPLSYFAFLIGILELFFCILMVMNLWLCYGRVPTRRGEEFMIGMN